MWMHLCVPPLFVSQSVREAIHLRNVAQIWVFSKSLCDANPYDWLKDPCPLLHGHGRGFRQTCFLCQKSFIMWSHLKIHIALHQVFFDRPNWQFQRPHGKWCPTCLWLLRSAHKEPHVYNLCHICGERALSRGRYSLARTNPKQG